MPRNYIQKTASVKKFKDLMQINGIRGAIEPIIHKVRMEHCYNKFISILRKKRKPISIRKQHHVNNGLLAAGGSIGSIDDMKNLLSRGYHVDCINKYGCSALHNACSGGREEMIDFLLANGANVNIQSQYGATPLHHYIGNNLRVLTAAKLFRFFDAGADISLRNSSGLAVGDVSIAKNAYVEWEALARKKTSVISKAERAANSISSDVKLR